MYQYSSKECVLLCDKLIFHFKKTSVRHQIAPRTDGSLILYKPLRWIIWLEAEKVNYKCTLSRIPVWRSNPDPSNLQFYDVWLPLNYKHISAKLLYNLKFKTVQFSPKLYIFQLMIREPNFFIFFSEKTRF